MKILNKLASEIARREGKKKSISIGDAREIVGILSDIFYEEGEDAMKIVNALFENGDKRNAKNAKKKKK